MLGQIGGRIDVVHAGRHRLEAQAAAGGRDQSPKRADRRIAAAVLVRRDHRLRRTRSPSDFGLRQPRPPSCPDQERSGIHDPSISDRL